MSSIISTFVLALALVSSVHAFFRINCANIQKGRIDPLVNPGALAAHSHSIVGGSSQYTTTAERETVADLVPRYRCIRDVQLLAELAMHILRGGNGQVCILVAHTLLQIPQRLLLRSSPQRCRRLLPWAWTKRQSNSAFPQRLHDPLWR